MGVFDDKWMFGSSEYMQQQFDRSLTDHLLTWLNYWLDFCCQFLHYLYKLAIFPSHDCTISLVNYAVFAFLSSLTILFLKPLKLAMSVFLFLFLFILKEGPSSSVDGYDCPSKGVMEVFAKFKWLCTFFNYVC